MDRIITRKFPVFAFLFFFIVCNTVYSQQAEIQDSDGPKVGLVLSGGGAKGIAHIGVLEVLEEAGIRVDYIAGTSMGSIVGALYSLGYSPGDMARIAETTNWDELFTDRANRRLLSMYEKETDQRFILSLPIAERSIDFPTGMVAGQNIFSWLSRQTWHALDIEDFSEFPIPYATVATDIETGEAVVFRSGYLPDAIRASISFPSAFTPHVVDGKALIDGGLVRNLPVQEVQDMGADIVIAVDVSTPLRDTSELTNIVSIMTQAVNYRIIEKVNEQKKLADLLIEVRELDNYHITDFDQAVEFIDMGRREAKTHFETLNEIAGRQQDGAVSSGSTHRQLQAGPDPDHRRLIERISVSGNEHVPGDIILSELEILRGKRVSSGDIESAVSQLYSSRLFNLITYRLHKENGDGYHLEIRVIENVNNTFRVGARYESQTHASLILQTSFRNLLKRGSNLRLHLRLGRENEFLTQYLLIGGPGSRIGFKSSFRFNREDVDFYSGGNRISSLAHHLLRADLFTGTFLNQNYLLGAGMRGDIIYFTQEINPGQIPFSDQTHFAVYGRFKLDTFNRRSYPVRGQNVLLQATFSDRLFGSPLNFSEQRLYWQMWHPVHESISLQHTLYLGRSVGERLPWNYWFSPNRIDDNVGMIRFGGYERYELSGRNIQMISAGIQVEPFRHRFLRFDVFYGNTFDEWNLNITESSFRTGFSLSAGALTVLGPLELIISGSSRNPVLYELQIGYEF